ncbi:MAG: c-type cytochrome [Deltaproteobacteria bacterium]|nr:c-type cytochrome [Deltaproteobacteria bacterium]
MSLRKKGFSLPLLGTIVGCLTFSPDVQAEDSKQEIALTSTIDGKVLYETFCAQCHGATGKAESEIESLLIPPPSDLTAAQLKHGSRLGDIYHSIREGIGSTMIRFKERLSDEQIRAIAKYVIKLRSDKGAN